MAYRNVLGSQTRFLLVSTQAGAARYAGGTHQHAEAGSFIFGANGTALVRQPGYSGYGSSAIYEQANSQSTVCPVVGNTILYDATNRNAGLPPSTDVAVNNTVNTGNFNYTNESFDLNSSDPNLQTELNGVGLAFNALVSGIPFDYVTSAWLQTRANRINYGICFRQFLMVNNSYLVIVDRDSSYSNGMQYAVSFIQGNNGDNASASNFSTNAGNTGNGDEVYWMNPSNSILRANTAALGGKVPAPYSGLYAAQHQNITNRTNSYHAALQTACSFNNGYGQMMSILEADASLSSTSSVTTKRNADTDPFLLYTVDGRGKTYGNYDVVFSQPSDLNVAISNVGLPYSIKTDATFLILSFAGGNLSSISPSQIFSCGASYIIYGTNVFVPTSSGDAQTSFNTTTLQNANSIRYFFQQRFNLLRQQPAQISRDYCKRRQLVTSSI